MNDWRKTSDSLPDLGDYCLVAQENYLCCGDKYYTYYLATYDVFHDKDGQHTIWWSEMGNLLLDRVTHWMPLPPEPPNDRD